MYNENIRREFYEYMNVTGSKLSLILSGTSKNAKFLKEAEKNGQLETYLQDFVNAATLPKVFIKLGQNYVFCRNNVPIPYGQIARVYEEKIKHRGVITCRFLILEDRRGKQLLKTLMMEEAESNGELATVMAVLKTKNPAIHLGYR